MVEPTPSPTPSPVWVPENFIIKLTKGGRLHYVFCEMVASFNFPAVPVAGTEQASAPEAQLFTQQALDDLMARQRDVGLAAGIEVKEALPLVEPGDGSQSWTKAGVRRQSATSQSGG